MRFYGRGATGNRRLTEGEVARLYARRERWEIDREELLDSELERWQNYLPPSTFGWLYAFARPVDAEANLLERAATEDDLQAVLDALQATGREMSVPSVGPGIAQEPLTWLRRGAEGWELRHEEPPKPGHVLRVQVDRNGHCHLFCDRAAEMLSPGLEEVRFILEPVILGCLASLLAMAGELYRKAGYVGAVDIGIRVERLAEGLSLTLYGKPLRWDPPHFATNEFRNTERVMALELAERPKELARELARPLLEGTTAGADFDPWA
jgi:hypothetical protein